MCDNSLRIMKLTRPINDLFPNAALLHSSHTQPVTHFTNYETGHSGLYQIVGIM